jgi:hypothetical protein
MMGAFGGIAQQYRVFRRRRATAGHFNYKWEDILGDYAGVTDARYMSFSEIDRWRAVPFDMPPTPERGVVIQQVRQLVEGLEGALDEGTASALDLYIEAWIGRWIANVETEYADHCRMIDLFRCQAAESMREIAVKLEHARARLDQVRGDYLAAAARLRHDALGGSEVGQEPEKGGPAAQSENQGEGEQA